MFLLTIGCMGIAGYEILHGEAINSTIQAILAGIFGHILTLGGAVSVTTLQNSKDKSS